jgi:K+-sensing histidine kinase KdpD
LLWVAGFVAATAVLLFFRTSLHEAHVALAYLLIIQFASARNGRSLGFVLAALAFLAFDWFFVTPYGTLFVQKSGDVAVLGAFLLTSLISAQLLERVRSQSSEARHASDHAELLRESSKLKDAVLASVSHDLRTPLTTIKALAHDMRVEGDERAATIEDEADRLNAMVANLLDLSRLNSGSLQLTPEPNEAEDLIGAAIQRVGGATGTREIRVLLEPGEPLLLGRFDFEHTLRLLVNLLDNAFKYSPAGTPVTLAAAREGSWLKFTVSDLGSGIPRSEVERIFDPFYRPAGSRLDSGGAGLGLSIACGIAEAQGGSLQYERTVDGHSSFVVRLPGAELSDIAPPRQSL